MTDRRSDGGIKVLSDEDMTATIRNTGVPSQVSTWAYSDNGQTQEDGKVVLVLTPDPKLEGKYPQTSLWDRRDLIQMARDTLRLLAPSPEDEILETLKRIESRLPGS